MTLLALLGAACGPGAELTDAELDGWDVFRSGVYQEPWPGGQFIVDGDIPLADEDELFDHYLAYVEQERSLELEAQGFGAARLPLVVDRVGSQDNIQSQSRRFQMTYCVSTGFGSRYGEMVDTMARAARSWADLVGVDFVHVQAEDGNCNASNSRVYFDVRSVSASYFARAFFPDDARQDRNVLVTSAAFTTTSGGRDLEGIMRHELGHALGFRHEHIRLSNPCTSEGSSGTRNVTTYDPMSVMHYPQCRSPQGGGYRQSVLDYRGAKELYGSAPALILTASGL